jgi:4-hydroxy-tetrahydrodipicolinate synthase
MPLDLGPILTAMVTPFDEAGRLDEAAAVALMHHLAEHGSDGLVVCGTTGEAATMDDTEHLRMIDLTATEMKGRCPVVAGVV